MLLVSGSPAFWGCRETPPPCYGILKAEVYLYGHHISQKQVEDHEMNLTRKHLNFKLPNLNNHHPPCIDFHCYIKPPVIKLLKWSNSIVLVLVQDDF